MRLTAFTDYTLRALMYLAVEEGRRATIPDIAAAYGIAENHLNKVVHQLGLAGEVITLRGRGGGLQLARPASEISLGAVIRRTERDLAPAPCLTTPAGGCVLTPACRLRGVMAEAMEAFLAVLDRYTLAELVTAPRRDLAALLGLPPPAAPAGGALPARTAATATAMEPAAAAPAGAAARRAARRAAAAPAAAKGRATAAATRRPRRR